MFAFISHNSKYSFSTILPDNFLSFLRSSDDLIDVVMAVMAAFRWRILTAIYEEIRPMFVFVHFFRRFHSDFSVRSDVASLNSACFVECEKEAVEDG